MVLESIPSSVLALVYGVVSSVMLAITVTVELDDVDIVVGSVRFRSEVADGGEMVKLLFSVCPIANVSARRQHARPADFVSMTLKS